MRKEIQNIIIDHAFSNDFKGNTIFYRWGYSSYYILPDKKKEKELRSCFKRFCLIFVVGWVAAGTLLSLLGMEYGPVGGFVWLPFAALWYHLETGRLLKGVKKQSWDEPKS